MTTPAEELRAAAQKLRETVAAASPGPWTVNDWGNVQTARHEEVAEVWPLQSKPDANAAYIALMGPDVGQHLADLLGSAVSFLADYPDLGIDHDRQACDDYACDLVGHALAVARALNGDR
ncbi:hypothetical protein [Streptomyces cinereoruber]|uniref:hypothetical protein n=1 Tax=Streptomyces cinereoruber TaxID=67260 RepID=UPI0036390370